VLQDGRAYTLARKANAGRPVQELAAHVHLKRGALTAASGVDIADVRIVLLPEEMREKGT
jgi:hypothetical protein